MATTGKNLSDYDKSELPDASELRVGLVVSQWNPEITEALFSGAYEALTDCGVPKEDIVRYDVPGSFELIFGARKIAGDHDPDVIIVIGSVIRGETAHFDYVCQAVAQGVKDLNLLLDVPVVFCVLTDDTWEQAKARSGGIHGNKGTEAAIAAIKMSRLNP